MGRVPCCDKANVKRGPWSPEEDAKLREFVEKYGTGGNWIALPRKAGLRRCGKSCRLRWLNYLRPNIKHGEFSGEEDRIICTLFSAIGSRWSTIAGQLPGRTDNDIKNYWNTKLKKKLMAMALVPHHIRKHSSHSSLQNSMLSSLFVDNFNNVNLFYNTTAGPPSSLVATSSVPKFTKVNPFPSPATTEDSLPMKTNIYYPAKDSILTFRRDESSNSPSEHRVKQEPGIGFHNYLAGSSNEVEPSLNDDDQGLAATGYGLHSGKNCFWADKVKEDFREDVLKCYDMEDVKKPKHGASVLGTMSLAGTANRDD